MSASDEWERRASTIVGFLGAPIAGLFFAGVVATALVDCSDLSLPLEQPTCNARVWVVAREEPLATVGGFLLGFALAGAVVLLFKFIGWRQDEAARRQERRTQMQALPWPAPSHASETSQVDSAPDQLQQWLAASQQAAERQAQQERQADQMRPPPQGAGSTPEAGASDPDERGPFLDY